MLKSRSLFHIIRYCVPGYEILTNSFFLFMSLPSQLNFLQALQPFENLTSFEFSTFIKSHIYTPRLCCEKYKKNSSKKSCCFYHLYVIFFLFTIKQYGLYAQFYL